MTTTDDLGPSIGVCNGLALGVILWLVIGLVWRCVL